MPRGRCTGFLLRISGPPCHCLRQKVLMAVQLYYFILYVHLLLVLSQMSCAYQGLDQGLGLHPLHCCLDLQSQLDMLFKLPAIWRIQAQPSHARAPTLAASVVSFCLDPAWSLWVGVLPGDATSSSELHVMISLGHYPIVLLSLVTW